MKLTQQQMKHLKNSLSLKDRPITTLDFLKANLLRYLIFFILVGLLAVFITSPFNMLIIGILIGAIARDFGTFRHVRNFWPINREIIDWKKVEKLLKENEQHK